MRNSRKRFTACILAAAVASSAAAGCQNSGTISGQNQETETSSVAETPVSGREGEESVENRTSEKGKTLEAQEPERAEISPENYEGWNQLLTENEISEAFAEGLDRFAYESGSAVLKDVQGNGNYSPLSLYYTLALAGCGARGETADQILEKLVTGCN